MAVNQGRGDPDWILDNFFSPLGWSGIGVGCQGHGGVTVPGSVQEASGSGPGLCGSGVAVEVLGAWLNWEILKVSSSFDHSTTL